MVDVITGDSVMILDAHGPCSNPRFWDGPLLHLARASCNVSGFAGTRRMDGPGAEKHELENSGMYCTCLEDSRPVGGQRIRMGRDNIPVWR